MLRLKVRVQEALTNPLNLGSPPPIWGSISPCLSRARRRAAAWVGIIIKARERMENSLVFHLIMASSIAPGCDFQVGGRYGRCSQPARQEHPRKTLDRVGGRFS